MYCSAFASCCIGEARQDSRAQIEALVTSCSSVNYTAVTSACRTPADRRKTQPPRVSFTELLPWFFRLRTPSAAALSGGGGTVHRSRRIGNGRPVGRRPHAQPSRRTGRRVKSPRRAHPIRTATRTPTGADARAHEICTYVIILISRVFVIIPPLRLSACTRAKRP